MRSGRALMVVGFSMVALACGASPADGEARTTTTASAVCTNAIADDFASLRPEWNKAVLGDVSLGSWGDVLRAEATVAGKPVRAFVWQAFQGRPRSLHLAHALEVGTYGAFANVGCSVVLASSDTLDEGTRLTLAIADDGVLEARWEAAGIHAKTEAATTTGPEAGRASKITLGAWYDVDVDVEIVGGNASAVVSARSRDGGAMPAITVTSPTPAGMSVAGVTCGIGATTPATGDVDVAVDDLRVDVCTE